MTDKLSIYNDALLVCGARALSSLTESRESRRLLDQVWDNGGVKECLEQGQWHFAMRSVRIDYDPAVSPEYGYQYAFDKGSDWIATSFFCSDEYYRQPITRYADENDYWYADEQEVYVKYVSNDAAYGQNLSIWPMTFKDFVVSHFASKVVLKITGDPDKTELVMGIRLKAMDVAKNKAAMALPTTFPARGAWNNARQRSRQQDGGNRSGPLIG